MFGYIVCNKKGLSEEEIQRYQSIYCGLCQSLKRRHGQLERLSLNFDMTFLIIFLASMYEPEEKKQDFRCMVHPVHKREEIWNKFTDYAADMTVALAYHKSLDDWADDHNHLGKVYADILKKGYQKIQKQYPRQCRCIEESVALLTKIEKDHSSKPDDAVNCNGKMLSELFVYQEDFWSNCLRSFGYELGRFIYLMDAACDYKKDIKKGSYNPLVRMNCQPEEAEDLLRMIIGNAAYHAEQLPLVQDENLIRNILYGGVWQSYYARVIGKEKDHGK